MEEDIESKRKWVKNRVYRHLNDIQHNDNQHNETQNKGIICTIQHNYNNALPLCWVSHFIYFYSECWHAVSLCWVSLCWVSICWVSLCWVSLRWVSLCCVFMLSVVMPCLYVECRYADCHYAECRYAKCHYAECLYTECLSWVAFMLSFTNKPIRIRAVMLNVVAPS